MAEPDAPWLTPRCGRFSVWGRLAVDYSIPLITNIKCAKLFIEALTRLDSLPVRSYDFRVCTPPSIPIPGFLRASTADRSSAMPGLCRGCRRAMSWRRCPA